MLDSFFCQPLGLILKEADLVSLSQIELALLDQSSYPDLKIGEIMALRGWIKPNTADFFAQQWHNLVLKEPEYPIGYYLQKANLLTDEQIEIILQEQNQLWLRFGSVAILKGWIKQTTLEFFLYNLFPTQLSKSVYIGKRHSQSNISFELNTDELPATEIDCEDIPWVD